MNSLKRFVRQAEMSHYALFRCCQFLQGCGNGDVLLQNARAEHSDLPEACSIIAVLEEFLKEQSQAQAWFHNNTLLLPTSKLSTTSYVKHQLAGWKFGKIKLKL